jgi:hypothetical protein
VAGLLEEYCWLVSGGWFVLREKYCCLVADKPSEQLVTALLLPAHGRRHGLRETALTVNAFQWGLREDVKAAEDLWFEGTDWCVQAVELYWQFCRFHIRWGCLDPTM